MAATAAAPAASHRPARIDLTPTLLDYILAFAAVVLLAMVLTALARGRGEWSHVPAFVWLHVTTVVVAVGLTPPMLLRRRGDRLHRRLGWIWSGAMMATALFSFGIRGINQGGLSFIHLFSALTLVQVPAIVRSARKHDHRQHRATVRAMVAFALLTAGYFTFPFDRLLGRWLFA